MTQTTQPPDKLTIRHPIRSLRILMEFVKFEHSIFALPFALIGAVLAASSLGKPHGLPDWRTLWWILVAMVAARTSAMAVNRIADARFDALNPRTRSRALPAGIMTTRQAWLIAVTAAIVFLVAAAQLNRLCLFLSPIALFAVTSYSWTKRFTWLTHFALGAAIGIAPVGAWLAVTARFEITPILLWAAVALWIGGFDILYALQDVEVDQELGLHSLPARFGTPAALRVSRLMHGTMLGILGLVGLVESLGGWYYAGVILSSALLGYEHALVRPGDLSRLNIAFFTLNGWISILLCLFVLVDRW